MLLTHTVSLSLGVRRKLGLDMSCLHMARHCSNASDGALPSIDSA